ncbi:ATP-dependent endonuclease [Sphingobium indicum]|uniref:ATP-dependent endonuclease n=2 Tax=Sphingobium indicum TaxID=332055 RepID=A0A1L5BT26_SPHIB|nr:AAA family ATPase [Sphingobium indicum]APL96039.1 ATP-dependent endonuclease [Sphingobium indicum B90A]KEY99976.1 ATP-dependent endonuclease [Sphingomonas sp. BHC-A]NYI24197.1 putative ATPase [Sphingobium indicum]RYL99093.1 ATP-dependent endonuclease [Sphingobium indicum]
MQLERARIKNFRSLRDVEVEFGAHTALIGGNGAGKSSILKAIEMFYSTSKTCSADDFFGRDQSQPIAIELTFHRLSEQEATAFEDRVRDGKLVVTRIFDQSSSSGRYHGVVPQVADFLAIRAHATATSKRAAYNELRENNPAYAGLPNAGSQAAVDQALLEWEANHPEQLVLLPDDGQFFGFQNNSRGKLQRHTSFVFVPAVREASADAADGKASVIGKLLELLVRSQILQRPDVQAFKATMTEAYQALVSADNMPELGALAGTLTADLRGLYQDAEVSLNWREIGEMPVPLPMADVFLKDDGFGGPVDRQGHGLQRAFIFTLLQHLARTTVPESDDLQPDVNAGEVAPAVAPIPAQAPTLILAIEEPELYQHPTKQRHFADVLRGLSSGTLPGVQGHTQIIFGSHSPMFISMGKADEIRLTRRTPCEDSEFKQCALQALDLSNVAQKLRTGWDKPPEQYTAQTLIPRLHILGAELSEGFFANGVILVEGRSDKAALTATARMLGVSFEAAGIAILSAEGKANLDRPYVIFRELGIPTFILWDCDQQLPEDKRSPAIDLALSKLAKPEQQFQAAPTTDLIADCYAHFEKTLELKLKEDLTPVIHTECLAAACEPFGVHPSKDSQKIPDVVYQMLLRAKELGHESEMLTNLVRAMWRFFRDEEIPQAH